MRAVNDERAEQITRHSQPTNIVRARGRLANELLDFVSQPALANYSLPGSYWHAHVVYARRAALALALGDLHPAQHHAELAALALAAYRRHGGVDPTETQAEQG